jgi:uncharacterized ferritin-like protein (DUF455 family)
MELMAYARGLIEAETLSGKLIAPPTPLCDYIPKDAVRLTAPGRPSDLPICHHRKVKVPRIGGMADPAQRARIIHALANHELQAIELFAWAVLAFPDAPAEFRRGLVAIIADEQKHFKLYKSRLEGLGVKFGDHLLTGHFWTKIAEVKTPLEFACTMCLTFENANLDFAQEYAEAAKKAGDTKTATALDIVHHDEIRHVRFGWRWLEYYKDEAQSHWDCYNNNVVWPLGPSRARGASFDEESRRKAGFSEAFIAQLANIGAEAPGGKHR